MSKGKNGCKIEEIKMDCGEKRQDKKEAGNE